MEMNPCLLLDDPSQLLQSDNAEKENNAEKEKILSPACPSASLDVNEEPERHTINPLLSPTKSTRLTMGSRVIILGTDNVEQRVPQYVGVEAEIVVVPVHPATWFKVKFDNGKIVTFRPSALRLVSDGTAVDANYSPPIKKAKPSCRPRSNSLKADKSPLCITVPTDGSTKLLTSIHTDLWPNCQVRILSGRMTGHTAMVQGSGNGWVQLESSSYGELAKRANELELISRGNPNTAGPARGDVLTALPLSSRPNFQRRRSNSEPGSPTEISNRRNEFTTRRSMKKERKETDLQREYVQKYIDKQQAKIRTRPDLKYWLCRIQGSMVDPKFERNVSRDVRSHFCHSCYMEMWSGSKFCWNENCAMSPVYWKLPGGGGSPPLARYAHAAATAARCSSSAPVVLPLEEDDEPKEEAGEESYACEVLLSLRSNVRLPDESVESQALLLPQTGEKSSVSFSSGTLAPSLRQVAGHKRKVAECGVGKEKRSDSSHTDSEDPEDTISPSNPSSALRLKIKHSPPPAQSVPLQQQRSPRPGGISRLKFKRIRGSPPCSGPPPSAEEFARRVMVQHEQQGQGQGGSSPPMSAPAGGPSAAPSVRPPLPSLVSSQLPPNSQRAPFSSGTSPLLTSLLNPDYPTNSATIIANVLVDQSHDKHV